MSEIKWQRPKVGNSIYMESECGLYCIRKDTFGFDFNRKETIHNYVPLIRKGQIWQQIGLRTPDEAKSFIEGNKP